MELVFEVPQTDDVPYITVVPEPTESLPPSATLTSASASTLPTTSLVNGETDPILEDPTSSQGDGDGVVTFGWDDGTIPTAFNSGKAHRDDFLLYSAGLQVTSASETLFEPVSGANVLTYRSQPGQPGAPSKAELTSIASKRFQAVGAWLGCSDPRSQEDDCHMIVEGFRNAVSVVRQDFEHVPSCGNDCVLGHFDFSKGFTDLTSIKLSAKDDDMPREFHMDDLKLNWNPEASTALTTAQPSALPSSSSQVDVDVPATPSCEPDMFLLGFEDANPPETEHPALQFRGPWDRKVNASDSPFTPHDDTTHLARFTPTMPGAGEIYIQTDISRLNAYAANFGCTNPQDDDCHMFVEGFGDHGWKISQDFNIPACGKNKKGCQLKPVTLADKFRDLTSLKFHALDNGRDMEFWMDHLQLAWIPLDCADMVTEEGGKLAVRDSIRRGINGFEDQDETPQPAGY